MVNATPASEFPPRIDAAYRYCQRVAREHYENFPVASSLLPAPMRPHIAAIYAFARRADDFADQPGPDSDERLRLLDGWGARLDRAVPAMPGMATTGDDLIFIALDNTIQTHRLPRTLFHDLLSAFRQDVTTTRYDTWREVLDYCRRSANPVGRLVLRVAGYDDPALDAQSDAVCTALQLTNFWQDFGRDWRAGRLYVPREVVAACGADEAELNGSALTAPWRAALGRCIAETARQFRAGRAVCDGVRGRLRYELRFTWLGGARTLERVERTGAALLTNRPALGARDVPVLLWRAARWPALV